MTSPDVSGLPFEEEPRPADLPGAPARRILTVSELTAAVRALLESSFGEVWIEGELSNCKPWRTGHVYFTLKDSGAQLRAVMFRSAVRYLTFKPEDGLHVLARGRLSVYEPKGEYQFVCEHMAPHGLGARQLAFEQLKKRLQAEGLFDAARKRPLPVLPRKIGVVTSLDGAALRDIVQVLRRRYPNAHLVIRPARVQGDGAAEDIARGVAAIGDVPGVDVVIVGRGGGSVEDLWAFNEEVVARAIAAARVPVISAVGHEVDFTIADFVADVRAPTPSAAAEMVVSRKDGFVERIDVLVRQIEAAARRGIERRRLAVETLAGRRGMAGWPARLALRGRRAAELTLELGHLVRAIAGARGRALHDLRLRLESCDVRRRLAAAGGDLAGIRRRIDAAIERARLRADSRRRELAGRLDSLSPLAVLGRGYAVCWNADGSAIIRSAGAAAIGDLVRVTLHQGELGCEVKDTRLTRPAGR